MDIIEIMFLITLAIASYAVAAYVAVKLTKEKLGARSSLFGIGIVTMFAGFIWSVILRDMVSASGTGSKARLTICPGLA